MVDASSVPMTQSSPGSFLQGQFFQTPAYQLMYGQNNNSLDPSQRFLNDPGTQIALQNSLNSLRNNYAASGLGQSGALAAGLQQSLFNNYNNYVQGQYGMFNNYQNQLANLAQFGSGQTGGTQANSNAQTLAQLLSNAYLGTAQQQSQAQLGTGSNISSLYGNQGVFNGNAVLNTGAAQSNNLFQGLGLQAQIGAANAASNAQTQNSLFQGMGAAGGARYLQGGMY